MNALAKLKNKKYLILALVFAAFNLGIFFLMFGFHKSEESYFYIDAINWFLNKKGATIALPIIMRPLAPLLALPLDFLGEGTGLILQSIVFYFLCVYLIFRIVELVFQNQKLALAAVMFFVLTPPILEFGLSYLIEMGIWFFYFVCLYLTLLYLKSKNTKLIVLNGILCGTGILMKETVMATVLMFGMMILLLDNSAFRKKISNILYFSIFFFAPALLLQIVMFIFFDYTALDWYLYNKATYIEGRAISSLAIEHLADLFRVLGMIGWPLALIGIFGEWIKRNYQKLKMYLALLPFSFSFLILPTSAGRLTFIFAPLGILLVTSGFDFLKDKMGEKKGIILATLLILVSGVSNYYFHSINDYFLLLDLKDVIR